MSMQWKTAISQVNQNHEIIRGYDLQELVMKKSFVEIIFLILSGELPTAAQTRMLNAMLGMMIDHGVRIGSTVAARMVNSLGNKMHTSVVAGLLGLGGDRHGGALESAGQFFQEHIELDQPGLKQLVERLKMEKIRVPGFGHRIFTHDKRADTLLAIAKETGLFGKYCHFALAVGEELNKISSKVLPLNMDGVNAAILSDMGFNWRMMTGFFMIGRTPGLVAQVYEEMMSGEGLRRLEETEEEYIGPAQRNISL